jgi:hypothetical protein
VIKPCISKVGPQAPIKGNWETKCSRIFFWDKSGGNDMSVNSKGKESAREKNLRKTP